jgi:Skp family chaperone for outer membrane proteins
MRLFHVACAIAVALSAGVARATPSGYVDTQRVRGTATKPVRMDTEYQMGQAVREKALNDAASAAQAAKPGEQPAAWARARDIQTANRAVAQKVDDDFKKGLVEILTKLCADRHVSVTAGPGVILVPGVDLTDEVIRRWDALDAKGMADELARTKAENERLRAAAAKPEPPKK